MEKQATHLTEKKPKNISSFRKLSYFLASAVVLSVIFSYYLFVYVAGKETEIIARNYRVLNKIGDNLQSRLIDNDKLAARLIKFDTSSIKYDFSTKARYHNFNLKDSIVVNDTFPASVQFIKIKEDTISLKKDTISLTKSFGKLFSGLRRNDIFKYHIVVTDSGKIIYSDNVLLNQLSPLDTSIRNGIVNFNNRKRVEIAGEEYYVFTHPFVMSSKSYIVIGMVSGEDYSHEKHSVPTSFLLVIMVTVFLIIVLFPFLKSLLISPQETLNAIDILATLLSLFMIFCIYTFLIIHLYAMAGPDYKRKTRMLENLADKIENAFRNDLSSLYNQAAFYDKLYAAHYTWLNKNYFDLKRAPTLDKTQIYKSIKPFDTNFKYIFWITNSATEAFRWTTDTLPVAPNNINYKERDYFKSIESEKHWFLSGDTSKKFYFEPVYSWLDGSYRGVLSLPGKLDSLPVVAIASEIKSVQNVLLPEELNYCLIDEKGNVLFHSDEKRNSNENILEECDNETLRAAILTRTSSRFSGYYMGANFKFYIKPVAHLPLFIITFADNQYIGNINVQIFTLTFVHILLILAVIITVLAVYIFFLKKGKRRTKQRLISFEDLYPTLKNESKDTYLILFNSCLIVFSLFISWYIYTYPLLIFSLFITNTICSTSLLIFLRDDQLLHRKKIITGGFIFFFVMADVLLGTVALSSILPAPLLIFISIVGIQATFIFIISVRFKSIKLKPEVIQTTRMLTMQLYQLGAQADLIIKLIRNFKSASRKSDLVIATKLFAKQLHQLRKQAAFIIHLISIKSATLKPKDIKKINPLYATASLKPIKFYKKYVVMLISCFLLVGAIPALRFYQYFYTEEYTLLLKYMHLQIAKNGFEKSKDFFLNAKPGKSDIKTYNYLSSYFDTQIDTSKYDQVINANKEHALFNEHVNNLRLNINPYNKKITKLSSLQERDSAFVFSLSDSGYLALNYTNLLNNEKLKSNKIVLQSEVPKYTLPKTFLPSFIFYSGILCFIVTIYFFILFFVKRFFLFEFITDENVLNSPAKFTELISKKLNSGFPVRQIIIGVPRSGKNNMVREVIEGSHKELVEIDLSKISNKDYKQDSLTKKAAGRFILLKHFDFDLSSAEVNREKLNLIDTLVQEKTYHVIITTSVHPSIFLKSLRQNNSMFDTEDYISNNEYYNWSAVLSGFELYVHPIQWPPKHMINKDDEEKIYQAHHTLFQYFHALWGSLDKNEKFVLYDLAEDNIANYQNRDAILSLHYKGIIVFSKEPRLIHESLRDFILSEVKETDIYKERVEAQGESSWGRFRLPFLLIIIVLLFFVFYTQKETFNQIIAVIVAFAASIPSLIKLLSSSSGKGKEA